MSGCLREHRSTSNCARPQKFAINIFFCSMLIIFILLAIKLNSIIYISIVAVTLQQWLRERAKMLLYTLIAYLFFISIFSYSPNKSRVLSRGGRRMNDED